MTDSLGKVVEGRYRLIEVIGRGAIGRVYRAERLQDGHQVAVKLLGGKAVEQRDFRERFRREVLISARIDHPNCIKVTDFGTNREGEIFMVMELLHGENLAQLLKRNGRLSTIRALRIIRQLLAALDACHAVSVVHRDVKPANLFLETEQDGDDAVKLLDFGFAKLLGSAEFGYKSLTKAGLVAGTLAYIAPEWLTKSEPDERTDLYSASIVLFEMLTGKPPFISKTREQLLFQHMNVAPPYFRIVDPTLSVLPEVEKLVRRGLAKDPDERFASAHEHLAAVDELLARPDLQCEAVEDVTEIRKVEFPSDVHGPSEVHTGEISVEPGQSAEIEGAGTCPGDFDRRRERTIELSASAVVEVVGLTGRGPASMALLDAATASSSPPAAAHDGMAVQSTAIVTPMPLRADDPAVASRSQRRPRPSRHRRSALGSMAPGVAASGAADPWPSGTATQLPAITADHRDCLGGGDTAVCDPLAAGAGYHLAAARRSTASGVPVELSPLTKFALAVSAGIVLVVAVLAAAPESTVGAVHRARVLDAWTEAGIDAAGFAGGDLTGWLSDGRCASGRVSDRPYVLCAVNEPTGSMPADSDRRVSIGSLMLIAPGDYSGDAEDHQHVVDVFQAAAGGGESDSDEPAPF